MENKTYVLGFEAFVDTLYNNGENKDASGTQTPKEEAVTKVAPDFKKGMDNVSNNTDPLDKPTEKEGEELVNAAEEEQKEEDEKNDPDKKDEPEEEKPEEDDEVAVEYSDDTNLNKPDVETEDEEIDPTNEPEDGENEEGEKVADEDEEEEDDETLKKSNENKVVESLKIKPIKKLSMFR